MSTFLSIGSGPGMGLATAERFAREGFQVVLSARNEGKVRDLAEQLKAKGHKVDIRTVDATDLAVNIGGAAVAAQAAAPKMLQRGSGSVLFTGGGFGLQPHPEYLSLSIGKAGIRALAQGIFEPFKEKGVHVATVTVAGFVTTAEDANAVAEHFWQLHSQPKGAWEVEAMYTPKG